jgi:2,3-diketo-5-methylthio-1-phosphopentane phosphatase
MKDSAPRVYLLDVEGTVAPISFVYERLFPYARTHFEPFIRGVFASVPTRMDRSFLETEQCKILFELLALLNERRSETDPEAPLGSLPPRLVSGGEESFGFLILKDPNPLIHSMLDDIYWLMDHDRKSTALKSLQGKIWKAGFESGELKGALFADVPDALARWNSQGKVAIYSSGSVEAQRLVFRHSIFGDLTGLISNYFDTRAGAKREPASYSAIAAAMGVAPDEVIFFSDVLRELDAAREAGCQTRLVMREGNAPIEDAHGHAAVESFASI